MGSLAQISSGAIRCSFNTRFRARFRRIPLQILDDVVDGSGADTEVRFRKVPVQKVLARKVPVQVPR